MPKNDRLTDAQLLSLVGQDPTEVANALTFEERKRLSRLIKHRRAHKQGKFKRPGAAEGAEERIRALENTPDSETSGPPLLGPQLDDQVKLAAQNPGSYFAFKASEGIKGLSTHLGFRPAPREERPDHPTAGPTKDPLYVRAVEGIKWMADLAQPFVAGASQEPIRAAAGVAREAPAALKFAQGVMGPSRLGAGGAAAAFVGAIPKTPEQDMVSRIPRIVAEGIVDSMTEYVVDPRTQAEERPVEFLGNTLDVTLGLTAAGKFMRAATVAHREVGILNKMRQGLRAKNAQRALDDVAKALDDLPADKADDVYERVARKVDDALEETHQTNVSEEVQARVRAQAVRIEEMRKARAEKAMPTAAKQTDEIRQGKDVTVDGEKVNLETGEVARRGKTALTDVGEAGKVDLEFMTRFASGLAGGLVGELAGGAMTGDQRDLHPISMAMGFAAGFLVGTPRNFGFGNLGHDLEKSIGDVIKGGIKGIRWDRPVNFKKLDKAQQRVLGVGGGVAGGTGLQAQGDTPGERLALGILGVAAGLGVATAGGRTFFSGTFDALRIYERYFEEGGEIPNIMLDVPAFLQGRLGATQASAREIKRLTKLRHDGRVARIADGVIDLNKAPDADRALVMRYLNGDLDARQLPAKYHNSAVNMRWFFNEMTMDLIDLKVVDDATAGVFLENYGTYLPRVYMSLERNDPILKAVDYVRSHGDDLKVLSDQNYLKKRGIVSEELEKAWGLINEENPNPAFILGARGPVLSADVAVHEFMNVAAANPGMVLLDDAIEGATKFTRNFGKAQVEHAELDGTIYRRLSLDNNKYGVLKGKYVEEGVADYIQLTYEAGRHPLHEVMAAGTSLFKAAKVTMNPATLMRNMMGQAPLSDIGGVSVFRPDKYLEGLADMMGKKPIWRSAEKWEPLYQELRHSGGIGGEFVDEVNEVLDRILKVGKVDKDGSLVGALSRGYKREMSRISKVAETYDSTAEKSAYVFKQMQLLHQGQERLFKITLYRHARLELKMNPADAIKHMKRYAFDYRDVPRWVKAVRSSVFGAPFISFSYKALPRILEGAMAIGQPKKFLRFWKYPAMMSVWNEMAAREMGNFGNSKGEGYLANFMDMAVDAMTGNKATNSRLFGNTFGFGIGRGDLVGDIGAKNLPEYVGGMQLLSRRPDIYARPKFTDATWAMPWGDLGEIGKGNLGKTFVKMGIPVPRQLEPSNPWLNTFLAMFTGKDPFTGREVESIPGHIVRQFAPQFLAYDVPTIFKAFKGDSLNPNQPGMREALLRLAALRQRPTDPYRVAKIRFSKATRALSDAKRKTKNESRFGMTRRRGEELVAEEKKAKKEKAAARALLNKTRPNRKFERHRAKLKRKNDKRLREIRREVK